MTDAYAQSGVDTAAADAGVSALVGVLRTIDLGRSPRSVPLPGHFAAVLEVAPNLGIALATDGVGSKLIVAEQAQRYDTVGIDCVAMNVNDVVCVGAEPIALLDYLAVERVDPGVMREIAQGLKRGAELAGVEIPGGEVAVLPELIRGHPSPNGFDLTAACVGLVALDAIVSGAGCRPGDALIGVPSSGLHSNGYSLARRALASLALDDRPPRLGGASVADVLLVPTTIYVRGVLELLRSGLRVHGLAHITGGGLLNLTRLNARRRLHDRPPAPRPAGVRARQGAGRGGRRRDVGGLQHGLRLLRGRAAVDGRRRGRAARRPPPRRAQDRHGHRPRRRRRAAGARAQPRALITRRLRGVLGAGLGTLLGPVRVARRARHAGVALLALPVLAGVLDLLLEAVGALLHLLDVALGLGAARSCFLLGPRPLVELRLQVRGAVGAPPVRPLLGGLGRLARLLALRALAVDLLEPQLLGLGIGHAVVVPGSGGIRAAGAALGLRRIASRPGPVSWRTPSGVRTNTCQA